VVNPIVLITTAVGFGFNLTIAVARLVLTYIVAVGVGLLGVVAFSGESLDTLTRLQRQPVVTATLPPSPLAKRKRSARYPPSRALPPWLRAMLPIVTEAGDQLLDLGRFLVLGALVATAVQTFVPQAPLLALSQNALLSTAALMLLASILSICSISDAPIAYTFLGTFAPGAVFAFLLFGQIVDMKNGAMLLATFRLRVVLFFVGCSALIVFALGTLITLGVI
jgi:uncharacterized membrane protein YraQ (UPF0718 family)